MKKIMKWGAIIIVVLIVIGAIAGGNSDDSTSSNTTSSDSEGSNSEAKNKPEAKTYSVGETVVSDEFELTITSVEEKIQVGGAYFEEKASEGAILVAVQWKYKNVSDKPIGAFSKPSIKLVDANDVEYDSDLGKTSSYSTELDLDSKVLSDLNPGITVKDAKVFEISKESFAKDGWKVELKVSGKSYFVKI